MNYLHVMFNYIINQHTVTRELKIWSSVLTSTLPYVWF